MNESKPTKEKNGAATAFANGVKVRRLIPSLRCAVISEGGYRDLDRGDVMDAYIRHELRIFEGRGVVCPEDWTIIEKGHAEGKCWFTVHRDQHGTKFWIVTDLNRTATIILLPSEY